MCELECQEVLGDAVSALEGEHDQERAALIAQHETAMSNLLARAGNMSPDELERERSQLLERQQTELAQLDSNYASRIEQIRKSTEQRLKLQHAQARLQLRSRHYQVWCTLYFLFQTVCDSAEQHHEIFSRSHLYNSCVLFLRGAEVLVSSLGGSSGVVCWVTSVVFFNMSF